MGQPYTLQKRTKMQNFEHKRGILHIWFRYGLIYLLSLHWGAPER